MEFTLASGSSTELNMFTGIVERTGKIVSRVPTVESVRLVIEVGNLTEGTQVGDSIAVNGCCLTVVKINPATLEFDVLQETEKRTNLKECGVGGVVNLERALRLDGRLGGHFVTGHIDATVPILVWEQRGKDFFLDVGLSPEQRKWVVPKGSIALDGISLTVGDVFDDHFTVWIIPHTREITALSARKAGDHLNIEFDLLAKYAENLIAKR